MTWDHDLAKACADYAQKLVDKAGDGAFTFGMLDHDPNRGKDVGENLWFASGNADKSVERAVHDWYGEIMGYDYAAGKTKENRQTQVVSHFTQVVWSTSTKLGLAIRETRTTDKNLKAMVIVARYTPKGNWDHPYARFVHEKIAGWTEQMYSVKSLKKGSGAAERGIAKRNE